MRPQDGTKVSSLLGHKFVLHHPDTADSITGGRFVVLAHRVKQGQKGRRARFLTIRSNSKVLKGIRIMIKRRFFLRNAHLLMTVLCGYLGSFKRTTGGAMLAGPSLWAFHGSPGYLGALIPSAFNCRSVASHFRRLRGHRQVRVSKNSATGQR